MALGIACIAGCAGSQSQATHGADDAADTGLEMIAYDLLGTLPSSPPDLREAYGSGPQQFGELRLARGATGPQPIVVLIHGGCWQSDYDLAHARPAATALASAGVAVWLPEYRRLGDAGGGWPGTFDDVAQAIDHVRILAARTPTIDTTRIVLAGHSAGGSLVLWAAARHAGMTTAGGPGAGGNPIRPIGVISLAGIADLAAYGAAPGGCNASVDPLLGGPPDVVPDRYRAVSPIARVPIGVPIRIVHGALDPIVPLSQSERFVERARAAGDVVELTAVPGAGHFDVMAPVARAWKPVVAAVKSLLGG